MYSKILTPPKPPIRVHLKSITDLLVRPARELITSNPGIVEAKDVSFKLSPIPPRINTRLCFAIVISVITIIVLLVLFLPIIGNFLNPFFEHEGGDI